MIFIGLRVARAMRDTDILNGKDEYGRHAGDAGVCAYAVAVPAAAFADLTGDRVAVDVRDPGAAAGFCTGAADLAEYIAGRDGHRFQITFTDPMGAAEVLSMRWWTAVAAAGDRGNVVAGSAAGGRVGGGLGRGAGAGGAADACG